MKTKRGASVTVWMLKSIKADSFLASYPAYILCPYYAICDYGMVVGRYKTDVEEIAWRWNEFHEQDKVEPVEVRVSLDFLPREADDEK